MKKEELRIGIWVYASTDADDKPEFCEVRQLKNRGLVWRSIGSQNDEGGNYTSYDNVAPIPLTPSILEKAGFKYDEIVYSKEYIWLASGETGYDVWLSGLSNPMHTHVSYLHQLQNLVFALLGEELEINL